MDTTLKTILQALHEYSSDINKRFNHMEERFNQMEERFDNRFEKIESRIDLLEDNMNARFDVIENRVNRVEHKADGLRADVQETLDWTSTKTIKHDRKLRELA